jgi:hypothetical protein
VYFLKTSKVKLNVDSPYKRGTFKQFLKELPLKGIDLIEAEIEHRNTHVHTLLKPTQNLVVRVLSLGLAELEVGRKDVGHVAGSHETVRVIEAFRSHIVNFLFSIRDNYVYSGVLIEDCDAPADVVRRRHHDNHFGKHR